jgi:hypothetical protein
MGGESFYKVQNCRRVKYTYFYGKNALILIHNTEKNAFLPILRPCLLRIKLSNIVLPQIERFDDEAVGHTKLQAVRQHGGRTLQQIRPDGLQLLA